jgi:hypothetical protein
VPSIPFVCWVPHELVCPSTTCARLPPTPTASRSGELAHRCGRRDPKGPPAHSQQVTFAHKGLSRSLVVCGRLLARRRRPWPPSRGLWVGVVALVLSSGRSRCCWELDCAPWSLCLFCCFLRWTLPVASSLWCLSVSFALPVCVLSLVLSGRSFSVPVRSRIYRRRRSTRRRIPCVFPRLASVLRRLRSRRR